MDNNSNLSAVKAYLVPVIIMFLAGLILFLPAGSFRFWEAWIWWSIITASDAFYYKLFSN